MLRHFCLAAIASAIVADDASAQTSRWAGPYIGVSVGHEWAGGDATYAQALNPDNGFGLQIGAGNVPAFTRSVGAGDGLVAGGFLGYNLQTGIFVYGIETDLRYRTSDFSYAESFSRFNDVLNFSGDNKFVGSIRARLGIDYFGMLFYVTGGLAYGKSEYSLSQVSLSLTPRSRALSADDDKTGWTAGSGVQIPLSQRIYLDFQYLYTDLGATTLSLPTLLGSTSGGGTPVSYSATTLRIEDTAHEVTARLTFRIFD